MRIEMDTFHPANSRVLLTHAEVLNMALGMDDGDYTVILRYMDMDYETPVAEYKSSVDAGRVVRI